MCRSEEDQTSKLEIRRTYWKELGFGQTKLRTISQGGSSDLDNEQTTF